MKIWKICERKIKKMIKGSGKSIQCKMPKLQTVDSGIMPKLRKVYPSLHNYQINSMNISNNEEFILSSDDLQVNLWSIERSNISFIAVDLKPHNLQEIDEVITCSRLHPLQDSIFSFGTSKGIVKVADMRVSGVCDHTAITFDESNLNSVVVP